MPRTTDQKHESCKNCRYSHTDERLQTMFYKNCMVCRIKSPTPKQDNGVGLFPVITIDDWCGEWDQLE